MDSLNDFNRERLGKVQRALSNFRTTYPASRVVSADQLARSREFNPALHPTTLVGFIRDFTNLKPMNYTYGRGRHRLYTIDQLSDALEQALAILQACSDGTSAQAAGAKPGPVSL
jgi:hypothetical protein